MFKLERLTASMALLICLTANSAFAQEYVVFQKNKTFVYEGNKVETLALKVGDTIRFQNEDSVFHNIFSLSKLKPFDFGAYDKGKSKSITFDKAGTEVIECAIHPRMVIEVVID
jgi:plastocyanin